MGEFRECRVPVFEHPGFGDGKERRISGRQQQAHRQQRPPRQRSRRPIQFAQALAQENGDHGIRRQQVFGVLVAEDRVDRQRRQDRYRQGDGFGAVFPAPPGRDRRGAQNHEAGGKEIRRQRKQISVPGVPRRAGHFAHDVFLYHRLPDLEPHLPREHEVPGPANRQGDAPPLPVAQGQPLAWLAPMQRSAQQRQRHEQQGQRTFRQQGRPEQEIAESQPAAPASAVNEFQRGQQRAEAQGGQQQFDFRTAREHREAGIGHQQLHRKQGRPGAEPMPRVAIRHQGHHACRQRGREPHRPLVRGAVQMTRRRLQPVQQRRFGEIRLAVQAGQQPVSMQEHVPGGKGPPRFVVIQQGDVAQPPEEYDGHGGQRREQEKSENPVVLRVVHETGLKWQRTVEITGRRQRRRRRFGARTKTASSSAPASAICAAPTQGRSCARPLPTIVATTP